MLAKKVKEVLRQLQDTGLLDHLILIGSWCGVFYIQYFGEKNYSPSIQTLDIDFLIPKSTKPALPSLEVPKLLQDLDFDADFSENGWIRFVHPELRVEFLVPRLGPQSDDPKRIPSLQINAMPLRHTDALTAHTISLECEGIKVRAPHPLAFALHKLFVSNRRKEKGKSLRDREMAHRILEAQMQIEKKNSEYSQTIWHSFTKKEKREIREVIQKFKEDPVKQYLLTNFVI